jgi:hypothetical protein
MMNLAELFVQVTPLASHAVTKWLDQFGLPTDCGPLADWLIGIPEQLDGGEPAYGSAELVLGAALVVPAGPGLFEIDEAGKWAVVQPVAPDGEMIVDLIAWHPARPDRWRLLTGEGEALGLIELDLLREGETIMVYPTPHSWLCAGGRGLCLLTDDWAVVQRILACERKVRAETEEFGIWLDQALRYREAPQVLVPEPEPIRIAA